jgi:4-carboxymuconolactone decarboxylase
MRPLPFNPKQFNEEQISVYETILNGPRGEVVGPLKVWLKSPSLAMKAQDLGKFARYETSLSPIMSELAILVTARIWSSGFEWSHHAPIALATGLEQHVVDALSFAKIPAFNDEKLKLIFQFCVELHRDHKVSDTTYAKAYETLGETTVIELVAICGYYGFISMTINSFAVPDGEGPSLPALDIPAHLMFKSEA